MRTNIYREALICLMRMYVCGRGCGQRQVARWKDHRDEQSVWKFRCASVAFHRLSSPPSFSSSNGGLVCLCMYHIQGIVLVCGEGIPLVRVTSSCCTSKERTHSPSPHHTHHSHTHHHPPSLITLHITDNTTYIHSHSLTSIYRHI
jgi:hypothetical protein